MVISTATVSITEVACICATLFQPRSNPVAWFPMISGLDGFDPFGLLHTMYVGNIDSEINGASGSLLQQRSRPSLAAHGGRGESKTTKRAALRMIQHTAQTIFSTSS